MKRFVINLLMIVVWTVMAVVLLITGTIVCGVKLLGPEVATPIITRFANENLNADVQLGRAQILFEPAFPILRLKLDDLTIISRAFSEEELTELPVYADTLFTLESFRGDIDVLKLITQGEIVLGDVELRRPGMNIVLGKDGKANFDIYEGAKEEEDSTETSIPPFSLRRFAFVEPREIRYYNAADSAEASVMLVTRAEMTNNPQPLYSLVINGTLGGPYASLLQMEDISFGLDGKVRWNPSVPSMVALEDFTVYGAFVKANLATEVAFGKTLTVDKALLRVDPVKIEDLLTVLPQELTRKYRLYKPLFTTNAAISLDASLLRPFSPATDSIPFADVNFGISESFLRYGKADIRKLMLDGSIMLRGNDLDSSRIEVRKALVSGPATSIEFSGEFSSLVSDPVFRFGINGGTDILKLPPILTDLIPGTLAGNVKFELEGSGRASMLSATRFHELSVDGDIDGRKLYFLSDDTAKMAAVENLCLKFNTKEIRGKNGRVPSMGAIVSVDTATVLVNGVELNFADLVLGAAIENNGSLGDSTVVVPLGAGLKLGRFNVVSVSDSVGARMRGLSGKIVLQRFKNAKKLPLISTDMSVDVLAAGSLSSRILLRNAAIHASAHKNPEKAKRQEAMKKLTDSISRKHPELSPDSVIQLAIAKRRTPPGVHKKRRVTEQLTDEDLEVIDWGLTKSFRKFLLTWELEGSVKTNRARLFTPYFPLRNNIRSLDITFTTDTVNLNGVTYRGGHSDLTINGKISNIRRGLTTSRLDNPLKVNLSITSDTIDVNQIAASVFAGSAYAERVRKSGRGINMNVDENVLEQELDAMVSEHPDSVGPLLIPSNIDGQVNIAAKKVLYDDLSFSGLRGDILIYRGAVNLHNLRATSDAGSMSLSALYSAPKADDMKFGLGVQIESFKIERFLKLVPAIDSIMPLMRDFSGTINASIAATVDIDSAMNLRLPTLDAAVRLAGDSIAFINPETYRTIGKWLRFRDRADNTIKRMSVELTVKDGLLQLYPFSFDIDRYRLGVLGHNDMALNFDYHISVLKSPLPFRFGVTIKGNPEKYKVRFGGAKFNDKMEYASVSIVDSARVNLVEQIENVFRRGVQNSRFAKLNVDPRRPGMLEGEEPVLSAADSLALIQEGILPAPEPAAESPVKAKERKKKSRTQKVVKNDAIKPEE